MTDYGLGLGIGDYGLGIMDYGSRTTDKGLGIGDYRLRITDYGLRITDYGLKITASSPRARGRYQCQGGAVVWQELDTVQGVAQETVGAGHSAAE